jgi:class 3 adenylate cyclase
LFSEHGWCNCHDFFDVRIGTSDGKAIIFKDINGNYNVAGNPVNVASRVMGFGDRQKVLLTDEAYKNMIDMTEDTDL